MSENIGQAPVTASDLHPVNTRWVLDCDDDGHWYLIRAEDHEAFRFWVYEEGPEVYSISLGSHPNTVTFELPEHVGKAVS